MKKSVIKIFSQICATVFLLTCFIMCTGNPSVSLLEKAEDCMEEYPDSSLIILSGIDPSSLHSKKHKSKYALLLIQALVKNDSVITSDSLIRQAVNYYSKHPNSPDLMKSAFYHASVLMNAHNYEDAITKGSLAYDLAHKLEDNYWSAKTAEQLADLYNFSYSSAAALPYAKESAILYKKSGKELNYLYAKCDQAIDEGNSLNQDIAISILDSIIDYSKKEINDTTLLKYASNTLLYFSVKQRRFDKAKKCIEYLKSCNESPLSTKTQICEAEILINDNKIATAKDILGRISKDSLDTSNRASLYRAYINLALMDNDYHKAYLYTDSLLLIQNNKVRDLLKRDIAMTQKKYYQEQASIAEVQQSKAKEISLIIFISSLITLLIAGIAYRYVIKIKNRKINEQIEKILLLTEKENDNKNEYEKISEKLKNKDSYILSLTHDIKDLYKDKWETLNSLCYDYFEQEDSKILQKQILNNINSNIQNLRSKNNIATIEAAINRYMDNLISDMREECKFLNEKDLNFIILILAGLSPRTICLTTDLKLKSFYTRRRRIIESIEQSQCNSKNRFIQALKNCNYHYISKLSFTPQNEA